ncbi:MAG: hypothetical protein O9346_00275 [Leptospiraceae bacterium]|nr:hypothetical protein [Leptospiraceae bacterium]MCZ8344830.1 hypothetical protein [Leptospiraceae bacterium]
MKMNHEMIQLKKYLGLQKQVFLKQQNVFSHSHKRELNLSIEKKGKGIIFLFGLLTMLGVYLPSLNAAPLDSNKLDSIRTMLVQSREVELEGLKTSIEKITNDPIPYLIAIADQTDLRVYVRTKAVALLSNYNDPSVTSYLETKIEDTHLHESIRKFSVKSYTESSYKKSPERVEEFLSQRANDSVLRKSIQSNLKTARENFNQADKKKNFKPNHSEQEFRKK